MVNDRLLIAGLASALFCGSAHATTCGCLPKDGGEALYYDCDAPPPAACTGESTSAGGGGSRESGLSRLADAVAEQFSASDKNGFYTAVKPIRHPKTARTPRPIRTPRPKNVSWWDAARALAREDWKVAEAGFRRAHTESPADVHPRKGLAWALLKQDRFAEAEALLRGALPHPDAQIREMLAVALYLKAWDAAGRDPAAARAALAEAVALDPANAKAREALEAVDAHLREAAERERLETDRQRTVDALHAVLRARGPAGGAPPVTRDLEGGIAIQQATELAKPGGTDRDTTTDEALKAGADFAPVVRAPVLVGNRPPRELAVPAERRTELAPLLARRDEQRSALAEGARLRAELTARLGTARPEEIAALQVALARAQRAESATQAALNFTLFELEARLSKPAAP